MPDAAYAGESRYGLWRRGFSKWASTEVARLAGSLYSWGMYPSRDWRLAS